MQNEMRNFTAAERTFWMNKGLLLATLACALASAVLAAGSEPSRRPVGGETGLPLPRFVSLKPSQANVRYGPGTNYDIKWMFTRRRLPLEVIAEFENWRRIRDWSGESGWMHKALLSSRRTAMVSPWRGSSLSTLRSEAELASPPIARVEPKVVVRVAACDGKWCHITVRGLDGYIRQDRLWGVYPGETVSGESIL